MLLVAVLVGTGAARAQTILEQYVREGASFKPIPVTVGAVSATWDGQVVQFVYDGADVVLRYFVRPSLGAFGVAGTADDVPFDPCIEGRVNGAPGALDPGSEVFDGVSLLVTFDGGTYQARYTLDQKTLVITFRGSLHGVEPGKFRNRTGSTRSIYLPYSGKFGVAVTFFDGRQTFATSFLDPVFSGATDDGIDLTQLTPIPQERASYAPSALGTSARERVYVTVSPDIHEVMPNVPFRTGPGTALLASKVFYGEWDGWQAHCRNKAGGAFDDAVLRLRAVHRYGCDEVVYVRHDWEHCETEVCGPAALSPCDNACGVGNPCCPDHRDLLKPWSRGDSIGPVLPCERCCATYPEVLPPDDAMGGEAGLARLASVCRELGYPFGVRTLYHPAFGTPDGQLVETASIWEPLIHDTFGTDLAMLDVITAELPGGSDEYLERAELLDLARTVHEGPILGEGGHGTTMLFAGIVDAVEAELAEFNRNEEGQCSGETCSFWTGIASKNLILDFDLLRVRPRMILQAMGYESRFFHPDSGDPRDWGSSIDMTEEQHDAKRAFEIAFAHSGGICLKYGVIEEEEFVKEYYLMQQLQLRYLGDTVQPVRIQYRGGSGSWTNLEGALLQGLELTDGSIQFHTKWDNGLEIYVNLRPEPLEVSLGGRTVRVPRHGWVAYQAATPLDFWCASVLDGAARVDFVQSEAYDFADGRGAARVMGALETDGAVVARPGVGLVDLVPLAPAGSIRPTTVLRVAVARYLPGDPDSMAVWRINARGDPLGPAAHQVIDGAFIEIAAEELARVASPPDPAAPGRVPVGFRIAE